VVSNEPVPDEVIAADHGLRADGGVGGLSLADRVSKGAHAQTANGQSEPVQSMKETSISHAQTANGQSEPVQSMKEISISVDDPRVKVYLERNRVIADAAKAGAHNRWGSREEKLATDYVSLSLTGATGTSKAEAPVLTAPVVSNEPVPAEVIAADHGLRADGGVGGPSLADRVNLGAQLLAER